MSFREFIEAIPKADLNLQLTGALVEDGLLMIARQNAVPATEADFEAWVALLKEPDYDRVDEIATVAGSWAKYPEDIARVVYDIGVKLSKQNVCYAEISVAPSEFMSRAGMTIETFTNALNDGRDRALRGWGVDMSWIYCIPSDNPRAGDDVARWATSASARDGNVVALGMLGKEDAQPVGQFRRAFATARKKEIVTVSHAGSGMGAAGITSALDELDPHRLTDSWGIHNDESLMQLMVNLEMPLIVSLSRALRLGSIKQVSEYPLRQLLDNAVQVVLSAGMPSLYKTTLIDEYLMAHEECGIALADIIKLARRSIELSLLDDERKSVLLARFDEKVESARATLLED